MPSGIGPRLDRDGDAPRDDVVDADVHVAGRVVDDPDARVHGHELDRHADRLGIRPRLDARQVDARAEAAGGHLADRLDRSPVADLRDRPGLLEQGPTGRSSEHVDRDVAVPRARVLGERHARVEDDGETDGGELDGPVVEQPPEQGHSPTPRAPTDDAVRSGRLVGGAAGAGSGASEGGPGGCDRRSGRSSRPARSWPRSRGGPDARRGPACPAASGCRAVPCAARASARSADRAARRAAHAGAPARGRSSWSRLSRGRSCLAPRSRRSRGHRSAR